MTITAVCISGCSMISADKYYAPLIQENKSERYSWHPCGGPNILNIGPNNTAIIYEDIDCKIGVRIRKLTFRPLLFGPLIFPIVPVFFVGESSMPRDKDNLMVSLEASRCIITKCDYKKCKLALKDGTSIYPADIVPNVYENGCELLFNIDGIALDSFSLTFGEVIINDNITISPMIGFEEAKGYTYCVGP